jgi:hypothetical protein
MSPMRVWADTEIAAHEAECAHPLLVQAFGEPDRRLCGCGAVAAHSPLAVAWAELDFECPEPQL